MMRREMLLSDHPVLVILAVAVLAPLLAEVGALTHGATTMLLIPTLLLTFLLVRGAPVLLYGTQLPKRERLPFALSAAVSSLGLVVVITQIGLKADQMNPDGAQALVGAALLSLILFPTLAAALRA